MKPNSPSRRLCIALAAAVMTALSTGCAVEVLDAEDLDTDLEALSTDEDVVADWQAGPEEPSPADVNVPPGILVGDPAELAPDEVAPDALRAPSGEQRVLPSDLLGQGALELADFVHPSVPVTQ